MAKLELRGVVKRFGQVTVCDGISLDVEKGQTVCLIGASGAGKSTLLRCINLLEPIEDGEIFLDGEDISVPGLDPQGVRARIGMVFQSYNLFPHMTALENVMLPIELKGDAQAREKAVSLLERVGLAERWHHYPNQLSGGEQQRVAIARAFATEARILFADEPTGNLDTATGSKVVDLLFELNREYATTLVLVTHDDRLASRCDRKLQLVAGELVSNEPAEEAASA